MNVSLISPARQSGRRTPPANGTAIGIGFALLANLAALTALAPALTALYVAGAVCTAYWLARRQPLLSVEFTLWLWLLGPQVRRMIDHATTYHQPSLVLAAAPLASLVLAPRIREIRWQGMRRAVRPLLLAAVAVSAGYVVGAVRVGLRPATTELLVWLVPVMFGLQVVAVSQDVDELRAMADRVFIWGALLVGVYGIAQFYVVPSWDAFWMDHVALLSIGSPEPYEIRVFSTLNSPGPAATFLAAAALYLTGARHRLRIAAQVVAYLCLGLSLVRSAWLACLLGLVIVVLLGVPRAKIVALVALAMVTVGVLQISGPLQTVIAERIEESREGRQDEGFQGRLVRYQRIVPMLADEALGHGLGTVGDSSAGGRPVGFTAFDSGLLEYGYALGLPTGLVALGALTLGGIDLARTGLRSGVVSAGLIAGALSILVQMAGGNALIGVGGITFFLLWAVALRQVQDAAVETAPFGGRWP